MQEQIFQTHTQRPNSEIVVVAPILPIFISLTPVENY